MSRRMLNCWIVALWLWVPTLFTPDRRYIWSRKSYSFKGRVPHAGVAQAIGWKSLAVIEYIPPKHDLWTRRNILILFAGKYRVWRLRVEEVRRFDSRAEALAFAYFKG